MPTDQAERAAQVHGDDGARTADAAGALPRHPTPAETRMDGDRATGGGSPAESALRDLIRALAGEPALEEVAHLAAAAAAVSTRAFGAYVERVVSPDGEVEIIAAAGEGTPPLGTRVPYPGSLTEEVIEHGEPAVVSELGAIGERMAPYLTESCAHCTGLVVPVLLDRETLGALILLRRSEQGRFAAPEVERARTLGDLVSVALRRATLLDRERAARADAERRHRELLQVTESRARLMRGFSHDVKNPLGAAGGHAELLADGILGELTQAQQDSVRRIRRSIRTALALIDDLLEFARDEAGEIRVEVAPTDILDAAREMVAEYGAQALANGLTLDAELPDALPAVRTDARRVRQVFSNLLSNAVKYTPRGGQVTVSIADRTDDGRVAPCPGRWAVVAVRDTGPGIPGEQQPRIFREFTRLEPGAVGGAGVGLAISRRVARALGGDITVESRVGVGSTFTLWLPLRVGDQPAER